VVAGASSINSWTAKPRAATGAGNPTGRAREERPAGNPLNDPSNLLSKRSVFYDYDDYGVKAEYRPTVEAHGAYLKSHPAAVIQVEGNCDERGSREYNIALGQRRADALKK